MARSKNDMFANMASAQVEMSDGGIVFTELLTGISLGQGTGILIDSIDYYVENAETNLSAAKACKYGWVTSNAISTFSINDRRVIHQGKINRVDLGTAGNGVLAENPKTFDFAPPIIVAAPRLYLAAELSASSGADGETIFSRFRFRYVDLTDKEYLEIAETFILVG